MQAIVVLIYRNPVGGVCITISIFTGLIYRRLYHFPCLTDWAERVGKPFSAPEHGFVSVSTLVDEHGASAACCLIFYYFFFHCKRFYLFFRGCEDELKPWEGNLPSICSFHNLYIFCFITFQTTF